MDVQVVTVTLKACMCALCCCRTSVEITVESRSKIIYEVSVSPDDFEVQWEFTIHSHDIIFGASFARELVLTSSTPLPVVFSV